MWNVIYVLLFLGKCASLKQNQIISNVTRRTFRSIYKKIQVESRAPKEPASSNIFVLRTIAEDLNNSSIKAEHSHNFESNYEPEYPRPTPAPFVCVSHINFEKV